MNTKTKQIIYTSLFGLLLLTIILFSYSKYLNNKKTLTNKEIKVENKLISLMIETSRGSGEYKESNSTKWPSKGYIFNSDLSNCENGSILTYNENNNTVSVKTNKSDRCFVYFDIEPPDIYVAANNIPTTYGKTATLDCSNSTATYNEQYNRIEISNVNTKYESCTLNYTDRTSKTYLNNYIISLAGTTQGTGQVASETVNLPNYGTAAAISQSAYTNISTFSSSWHNNTSGTSVSGLYSYADNKWISDTSKMTSGTYYHFKFTPSESGYYQICYGLSSGHSMNDLYVYNDTTIKTELSASKSSVKSGCAELEYVSNSSYIKVTQRAYSDSSNGIATLSFNIKKVASVETNINAGIRYEGKNPNNYIWFNNELWRIIGVFDSGSHGQSNKNLVKIIRNDSIGALVWDKSNTNGWETSSLKNLLNGAYYNAQDGTSTDYCYGYSTSVKSNCDYRKIGIQTGYRSMIQNVTWYLGGTQGSGATTIAAFYGYERGTTVYSGNATSTTGYIGLIYPSDYGYSVLSSSCARTTNLSSYDTSSCAGQSWLYGNGDEWTVTPHSSTSNEVFNLMYFGALRPYNAQYGYVSRPVLYLNESVYYVDGDGSMFDPIIIGM